jgi:heme exporter protein CcmB
MTWILLRKDLRIAARAKALLGVTLLFSVLCVLVFAFGFLREGMAPDEVVPGVLWVTLLFSGTVVLLRLFSADEEAGALELLQSTAAGPQPVFFSKAVLHVCFCSIVALLVLPLVMVFFNARPVGLGWVGVALTLGLLGQSLVGTLCAALLIRVHLREVLLPLVLYPTLAPLLIAGVKVTAISLAGGSTDEVLPWLVLMMVFDAVFMLVSSWLHARVMEA